MGQFEGLTVVELTRPPTGRDRFPTGRVLVSLEVAREIGEERALELVGRHAAGDWGETLEDDNKINEHGVTDPALRILSVYAVKTKTGTVRISVMTFPGRGETMVLQPAQRRRLVNAALRRIRERQENQSTEWLKEQPS